MNFPKGATQQEKREYKNIWVESLTKTIIDHERNVKNMEETIKNYKDKIATTKKHIKEYQTLLKDAEDTKVD
jgi:peptidoglycan hydrolase CwlO-like protein